MVRKSIAAWQELYHEGYYHGANSGYPAEGYELAHPTWTAYLEFVRQHRGEGLRWLDLGCAYGYLVDEARRYGMLAYGLDVSDYALRYFDHLRGRMGYANVETLPVRSESVDVVSAFDLAEHLEDPRAMLREAWRVLKPSGLFWLGTPDPLNFHLVEETHVSEQPPSMWVSELLGLGFDVKIRFYAEEFNLEVLAVKAPVDDSARELFDAFGKDYFGPRPDILVEPKHHSLRCALHKGWSPLSGSRTFTTSASLYLLNVSDQPLAISIDIDLAVARDLQMIVDNVRVGYMRGARGSAEFSILPGGHQFVLLAGEYHHVDVRKISLAVRSIDYATHNLQLPYDQYQRYHSLREIVGIVRREKSRSLRVLDVGGYPGQILGFLPDDEVTVVDVQAFDSPHSHKADGLMAPFPEESFDVVTTVDVLEHLDPEARLKFLEELWRVAEHQVVVAGPFSSTGVRQAEEILSGFIEFRSRTSHHYLAEHAQYGLPDVAEVEDFFRAKGAVEVVRLRGTPLMAWLLTMGAYFYLDANPQLNHVSRTLTRFLNELGPTLESGDHSYRHVILASKTPFDETQREAFQRFAHAPRKEPFDFSPVLSMLSLFNFQFQEEKAREFQQRFEESAGSFQSTMASLQRHLTEILEDRDRWKNHSHSLELDRQKLNERYASAIDHYEDQARSMHAAMTAQQEQTEQLRRRNEELTEHIPNLARVIAQRDSQFFHLAEAMARGAWSPVGRMVKRLARLARGRNSPPNADE